MEGLCSHEATFSIRPCVHVKSVTSQCFFGGRFIRHNHLNHRLCWVCCGGGCVDLVLVPAIAIVYRAVDAHLAAECDGQVQDTRQDWRGHVLNGLFSSPSQDQEPHNVSKELDVLILPFHSHKKSTTPYAWQRPPPFCICGDVCSAAHRGHMWHTSSKRRI